MTREEWCIEVLLREGFDVDIGECKIRYPSRPEITPKAREAVEYLVAAITTSFQAVKINPHQRARVLSIYENETMPVLWKVK